MQYLMKGEVTMNKPMNQNIRIQRKNMGNLQRAITYK